MNPIDPRPVPFDHALMRSFLIELAKLAGKIALDHYHDTGLKDRDYKGRGDYVTHVDKRIEDSLRTRIGIHYPDHLFLGEEGTTQWPSEVAGPCWIVDPIDGTTNYIRGVPAWAISICYCDEQARPRHAVIYDPVKDEMFLGERGAGLWLNDKRVYASNCQDLHDALVVSCLPFRQRDPIDDVAAVMRAIHDRSEDHRRGGSAALDLAYVAVGRFDVYWELGIKPWDTAAGELLVQCGGGVCSDFCGQRDGLLGRRSIVAAASEAVHAQVLEQVAPLQVWLQRPGFDSVG